jgi:serine/threonine protein kinase
MTAEPVIRSREHVVEGIYRLGKILHNSSADTIYETTLGDDATPAVIRIQKGGTPDAERLLARWRKATGLSHPNLIPVYAAGSSVLDEIPVIYVVMQRADESLAGVLAERALSEQAVGDMLTPTLSALAYLHKNGYAHTSLKPSNILAVGDLLKISADKATPFKEGASGAEDIWALGALIVESLTRKPPKIEHDWAPYILREASEPFIDVVRNCLESNPHLRWTVDEVAARLGVKLVSPPPAPALTPVTKAEALKPAEPLAAETVPAAKPVEHPVKDPVQQIDAKPVIQQPVIKQEPATEQDPVIDEPDFDDPVAKDTKPEATITSDDRYRRFTPDEEDHQPRNRRWIYGGIVALVVIGSLVGIGRQKDRSPATAASNPPAVQSAPPEPSPTPRPSPIPESISPPRADSKRAERSAPPSADHAKGASSRQLGRRAEGWSVVVASYNSRGPAEKRAHDMARRWPKFKSNVFEQKADKTYYLVVVGQNLSEDEAQALRKRAVSSGLPRDTYIKRFF